MSEISVFMKETQQSSLLLSPLCGHSGEAYNPEEGHHQTSLGWYSDLRLPASRAVRNMCLLVSATQCVVLCYGSQMH